MPTRAINRKGKIVDCLLGQIADHEPGLFCPNCQIDMFTRFNREGYQKHLVHKTESYICKNLDREYKTCFHAAIQRYFELVCDAEIEKVYRNEEGQIIHRADVVLPNDVVIEVQHSLIKSKAIADRENCYGERMIWLLSKGHFSVVSIEKHFARWYQGKTNSREELYRLEYGKTDEVGKERFFIENLDEFFQWNVTNRPMYFVYPPDGVSVHDETFWVNGVKNDLVEFGKIPVYKIYRLADQPTDPIYSIPNFAVVHNRHNIIRWVTAPGGFIVAEKMTLEKLATDLLREDFSFDPVKTDSNKAREFGQKLRLAKMEILAKMEAQRPKISPLCSIDSTELERTFF